MKRVNRKKAVFCMAFLCLLCGFWSAGLLIPDRIYSDWEKRLLAQKPELTVSSVLDGSYGTSYEEWLTDQFPGRELWVSIKTRCELLLGKKEINGIYIGQDGYLFTENKQTADWDKLETQMCERYGDASVSRIRVPNAGTVLEQKLPYGIDFPASEDAVLCSLRAHRDEYIYYRTDHHWTMLGAYYAYEAWAIERGLEPLTMEGLKKTSLKTDFLGTHYGKIHYAEQADEMILYDPEIDCQVVYDLGSSDASGMYQAAFLDTEDAYRYFLDGNHGVTEIVTGQTGGHLVVLKDSFANCLVPFLSAHYGKITVIDPRYFRTDIVEWLSDQEVTEVLIVAQDTTEAVLAYSSMCSSPWLKIFST